MSAEPIHIVHIVGGILVGLGATLVIDLWALFLRRCFNILSLSYCLVGRWLRYMPAGTFRHASIASTPAKSAECTVGWIAHYCIGAVFGLPLVILSSGAWLERPTILPALLFGIGTVLVPFLIMQPSLGFGIAAAKTPNPARARLKSVVTHAVLGIGLYVCALLLSQLLRTHA